jgi:hypothetical protein
MSSAYAGTAGAVLELVAGRLGVGCDGVRDESTSLTDAFARREAISVFNVEM